MIEKKLKIEDCRASKPKPWVRTQRKDLVSAQYSSTFCEVLEYWVWSSTFVRTPHPAAGGYSSTLPNITAVLVKDIKQRQYSSTSVL